MIYRMADDCNNFGWKISCKDLNNVVESTGIDGGPLDRVNDIQSNSISFDLKLNL